MNSIDTESSTLDIDIDMLKSKIALKTFDF